MDKHIANQKKENLIRQLKNLDSLVVEFSGGVGSTFLLAVALDLEGYVTGSLNRVLENELR